MTERDLFTFGARMSARDKDEFLASHPNFYLISRGEIHEISDDAWKQEIANNKGLIDKSMGLYSEHNPFVMDGYRNWVFNEFYSLLKKGEKESAPFVEQVVEKIFEHLNTSHEKYAQLAKSPYKPSTNNYVGFHDFSSPSHTLHPRHIRLFLKGNGLIGEEVDYSALQREENLKTVSIVRDAVRTTNKVMFVDIGRKFGYSDRPQGFSTK